MTTFTNKNRRPHTFGAIKQQFSNKKPQLQLIVSINTSTARLTSGECVQ